MNTEKTLPFTWAGWDNVETLHNQYNEVKFTEDFGSIKSGEYFEIVDVNYGEGVLQAWDSEGQKVIKTVHFKSVAI